MHRPKCVRPSFDLLLIAFLTLSATAFAAPLAAQEEDEPTIDDTAVAWMTLIMNGDFVEAAEQLSPESPIPADQLEMFWPQIEGRYGTLRRLGFMNRGTHNGLDAVMLLGYFDKDGGTASNTIRVTFDSAGRPAGFFVIDG